MEKRMRITTMNGASREANAHLIRAAGLVKHHESLWLHRIFITCY
jgi:hypothetical protein